MAHMPKGQGNPLLRSMMWKSFSITSSGLCITAPTTSTNCCLFSRRPGYLKWQKIQKYRNTEIQKYRNKRLGAADCQLCFGSHMLGGHHFLNRASIETRSSGFAWVTSGIFDDTAASSASAELNSPEKKPLTFDNKPSSSAGSTASRAAE